MSAFYSAHKTTIDQIGTVGDSLFGIVFKLKQAGLTLPNQAAENIFLSICPRVPLILSHQSGTLGNKLVAGHYSHGSNTYVIA